MRSYLTLTVSQNLFWRDTYPAQDRPYHQCSIQDDESITNVCSIPHGGQKRIFFKNGGRLVVNCSFVLVLSCHSATSTSRNARIEMSSRVLGNQWNDDMMNNCSLRSFRDFDEIQGQDWCDHRRLSGPQHTPVPYTIFTPIKFAALKSNSCGDTCLMKNGSHLKLELGLTSCQDKILN